MPFSVDISTQNLGPVPPAVPGGGVASAPQAVAQQAAEQGISDAIGDVVTGGTFDGMSLTYDPVDREISGTNTDKGSVAVAAHEAAPDPHSQYHTAAEVAADIAVHSAAADPHGDRAYTDSAFTAHGAALDPHPQYVEKAGDTMTGTLRVASDADRRVDLTGTANSPGVSIERNSDTSSHQPINVFTKTRGTAASPTGVLTNDILGSYLWWGHNGTAYAQSASIQVRVPSDWAVGDHPSSMAFAVTPAGSTTNTTMLTIAGDGIVQLLPTSAPAVSNSHLTMHLASNTSLVISVRGSDGTLRTATLTLA